MTEKVEFWSQPLLLPSKFNGILSLGTDQTNDGPALGPNRPSGVPPHEKFMAENPLKGSTLKIDYYSYLEKLFFNSSNVINVKLIRMGISWLLEIVNGLRTLSFDTD